MRVIHDIIACYSEIFFSMLFSRYESDTLISQFATYSNLSFDSDKSTHVTKTTQEFGQISLLNEVELLTDG